MTRTTTSRTRRWPPPREAVVVNIAAFIFLKILKETSLFAFQIWKHRSILRDIKDEIEKLESGEEFIELKFEFNEYEDSIGRNV